MDFDLSPEELEQLVLDLPIAQRKLVTSSADFSVATLVGMLRDESLVIPKFQRNFIWNDGKSSRLIESLILQCPIPVVYLNRRSDEILEVVDGNQRISSLRRFLDGQFALTGLTAYPELDGDKYDHLDPKFQRQVKNRTIRCVIIEPESHPQIKFDVFERLNSGSTPLSPQELRHGLHYGPFVQQIEGLAKTPKFVELTGLRNDTRMRRDELVLRFFALSENLQQYAKPLSAFLTDFLRANRVPTLLGSEMRRALFMKALDDLSMLLGDDAFRFPTGTKGIRKFNTAFYDAISVGYVTSNLVQFEGDLAGIAADVKGRIEALQQDPNFVQAVVRATSDKGAIETRIVAARAVFNDFA
jgi:hypothetical protein